MKCNEQQALIIIPDVHGRTFWRYPTVTYREAHFIFLGDYLDPYPDEKIKYENALQGLLDIIDFKKKYPERVTLLFGNHDMHYLHDSMIKGSRFDEMHAKLHHDIFDENKDLFRMAYETTVKSRRYLFSHAGVGRMWIKDFSHLKDEDITADWLNKCMSSSDFLEALDEISPERGGFCRYGSMIWADAQEQVMTLNVMMDITQIFGHSFMLKPLNIQNHIYCLDCSRAFYLNLEDGLVYDLTTDALVEESI